MKITDPKILKDTTKYLGMSYVEYYTIRELAKRLQAKSVQIKKK